jgi:transcriptional regulator with XRE-family HTH domain
MKRVAARLDFKVDGNSVADRCEDFLVSAIKIGLAQPIFHPEHLDNYAIRVLRKVRGLSKEKLAHQLGVVLMTINRWEDGSTGAEPKRFDIIQRVLFDQAAPSTPETSPTSTKSTIERPTLLNIRQRHRQVARWRPEPTRHRLGTF